MDVVVVGGGGRGGGEPGGQRGEPKRLAKHGRILQSRVRQAADYSDANAIPQAAAPTARPSSVSIV